LVAYPIAAVKIPKGALVNINAAGYATNATDASGETFAGVAYETVDNSAGSAGDLSIRVETTDAATTNSLKAGVAVESISATSVRIRIDRYAS
jgi:hypothetical protein